MLFRSESNSFCRIYKCYFYNSSNPVLFSFIGNTLIFQSNIDKLTYLGSNFQIDLSYTIPINELKFFNTEFCIQKNELINNMTPNPVIELHGDKEYDFNYYFYNETYFSIKTENLRIKYDYNINLFIENSIFNNIYAIGVIGGAISLSSLTSSLYILKSTFSKCYCDNNGGGGIYFSNSNDGQIVIEKICANECYCKNVNSNGQFGFFNCKKEKICEIYSSSILNCPNTYYSNYGIYITTCISLIRNLNNSENYASLFSSVSFIDCSTFKLQFSNFVNNFANSASIFYLSGKGDIENINFINNSHIRTDLGIIRVLNEYSTIIFSDSIFFNNTTPIMI